MATSTEDVSSFDSGPSLEELPDLDGLPSLDLPDLETPSSASADSLPEEDFLSSEELASLDDQFDFVTVSQEPLEGEDDPGADDLALAEEFDLLDSEQAVEAESKAVAESEFDEISLDDFVSFDEEETAAPAPKTTDSAESIPAGSEDDLNEEFLDIDIDISDDIDDEELEILEGAQVVRETPVAAGDIASEEVDISEFGDFEEITDFDGPVQPKLEPEPVVSFGDDFDLDLDADDLTLHDGDFEETILDQSLNPDDSYDADDLKALEDNLTSGIRTLDPAPAETSDLAAAILSKIEQELSSIKREISDLKKDLSGFRSPTVGPSSAPAKEPEPQPGLEAGTDVATKEHKGFFDEEDDETIALTGDELDNILSTAEISEAEDSGESLDDDLTGEDLIVTDSEGNLPPVSVEAGLHVTDEEFFSGTSLEDEETSLFETPGGVPESIELEEDFPQSLDEDRTEDLLSGANAEIEADPWAAAPERLEIPFEDEPEVAAQAASQPEPQIEPADEFETSFDSDFETMAEPEGEPEPQAVSNPAPEPRFIDEPEFVPPVPVAASAPLADRRASEVIPESLRDELKAVLAYMDKLLVSLPDEKIQEFAESEHFEVYKKLFEELGLKE
jgi:hypothetical protein